MILWRLEHKQLRTGPFCSGPSDWMDEDEPNPYSHPGIYSVQCEQRVRRGTHEAADDVLSACLSWDQLRTWFQPGHIFVLSQDFMLCEYEVAVRHCWIGWDQVGFPPYEGKQIAEYSVEVLL